MRAAWPGPWVDAHVQRQAHGLVRAGRAGRRAERVGGARAAGQHGELIQPECPFLFIDLFEPLAILRSSHRCSTGQQHGQQYDWSFEAAIFVQ